MDIQKIVKQKLATKNRDSELSECTCSRDMKAKIMKTVRTRLQCSPWGCYRHWFRRVITVSQASWCHLRSSAPRRTVTSATSDLVPLLVVDNAVLTYSTYRAPQGVNRWK